MLQSERKIDPALRITRYHERGKRGQWRVIFPRENCWLRTESGTRGLVSFQLSKNCFSSSVIFCTGWAGNRSRQEPILREKILQIWYNICSFDTFFSRKLILKFTRLCERLNTIRLLCRLPVRDSVDRWWCGWNNIKYFYSSEAFENFLTICGSMSQLETHFPPSCFKLWKSCPTNCTWKLRNKDFYSVM